MSYCQSLNCNKKDSDDKGKKTTEMIDDFMAFKDLTGLLWEPHFHRINISKVIKRVQLNHAQNYVKCTKLLHFLYLTQLEKESS